MLNKVEIQGRLTGDPELKTTQTGKSVVSITLACDRARKDEGADFINCVAWEKTAEMISQWFRKGREAIVVGRLGSRKYQDRAGNQRTAWEVTVSEIHFCGSKPMPNEGTGEEPENQGGGYAAQEYERYARDEDELPF